MKTIFLIVPVFLLSGRVTAQISAATLEKVGFADVQILDDFWKPRISTVSRVTIPVCIEQTEVKTPRIRNFEKVARRKGEKHEGIYYDDSDVYKALEAIAYSLKNDPDKALEQKADDWIDKIAAAQLPDGYLNTYYTLNGLENRWTDMEKHEAYNAGHLFEAAVAYYNATGKRKLLDVSRRFADHIDSTFRQRGRPWVAGHQEIELALVKLHRVTNEKRYLDLAYWFLEQRGRGHGKGVIWDQWKTPEYCQDAVPLRDQREITGHAVRAMYMYTGAADVSAARSDSGYMHAMKTVWEDVVYRNMYITGGIGSSGRNEGFSVDYDLPNEEAYAETCASVGMVFWNHRMNLLTGESKYIDILERSLYNGALDGLSMSGDRFFYGNPLASSGQHSRREWFGTACCPANIARLVESVGDYIYAKSSNAILVNLFVGSQTVVNLGRDNVIIRQETDYPWQGDVRISVTPGSRTRFPLYVRIPGWAKNEPVPGKTYFFADDVRENVTLRVNGKTVPVNMERGYAVIDREWRKGDVVSLSLPMPVRRVAAIEAVKPNRNRIALQRGPLVYCVEHVDNKGRAKNFIVPDDAEFTASFTPDLLEGVVALQSELPVFGPSGDGTSVKTETQTITAIPYFAWANRGPGELLVWLPRKIGEVTINGK
jgi:uncharacterized protein